MPSLRADDARQRSMTTTPVGNARMNHEDLQLTMSAATAVGLAVKVDGEHILRLDAGGQWMPFDPLHENGDAFRLVAGMLSDGANLTGMTGGDMQYAASPAMAETIEAGLRVGLCHMAAAHQDRKPVTLHLGVIEDDDLHGMSSDAKMKPH